jgi:hypothetical protein
MGAPQAFQPGDEIGSMFGSVVDVNQTVYFEEGDLAH